MSKAQIGRRPTRGIGELCPLKSAKNLVCLGNNWLHLQLKIYRLPAHPVYDIFIHYSISGYFPGYP